MWQLMNAKISTPSTGYQGEGFLTLQDGVSRSLTEVLSGQSTDNVIIEMNRFPYPPYADDPYVSILSRWMPAFIVLGYLYTAINITKSVVKEKEKRLKVSTGPLNHVVNVSNESIALVGIDEDDGVTQLAPLVGLVLQVFGLHEFFCYCTSHCFQGRCQ